MSQYKYWWRPNVERALRQYPAMRQAKNDIQSASITPNYNPMPSGNGTSRTTENLAMRQLPDEEESWIHAIESAQEEIELQSDGEPVMELVTCIYFKKTHTLCGAAEKYNMSESTAKRRIGRFIMAVAKHKGLI